MKRLWFKKKMRDAILLGVKTRTSRTHPLDVGHEYLAVSGSRFKAQPFGVIKIESRFPTTLRKICEDLYQEEGFSSPKDAWMFVTKELPQYQTSEILYTHRFSFRPEAPTAEPSPTGETKA